MTLIRVFIFAFVFYREILLAQDGAVAEPPTSNSSNAEQPSEVVRTPDPAVEIAALAKKREVAIQSIDDLSAELKKDFEGTRKEWADFKSQLSDFSVVLEKIAQPLGQKDYATITEIWRKIFNLNRETSLILDSSEKFSKKLRLFEKSFEKEFSKEVLNAKRVKKSLEGIEDEIQSFENETLTAYREARDRSQELFFKTSKKRALAIKNLIEEEDRELLAWSNNYFLDIKKEFLAIPLRWMGMVTSRYHRFIADLTSGVKGWLSILRELFLLFFFAFLGFLFVRLFLRLNGILDSKRSQLLRKGRRDPLAKAAAIWIQRLSPYIQWVSLILFLDMSHGLIEATYFRELAILFPYVTYYAYYRIFRIAIAQILSSYAIFGTDLAIFSNKEKLLQTTKVLGVYLLVSYCIIHTVKTTVGEGFIFLWIEQAHELGLFIVGVWTAYRWKPELYKFSSRNFSEKIQQFLQFLDSKRLSTAICLPLAIATAAYIVFKFIYRWSERFDVVKSISAEVFRRQVEGKKIPVATKKFYLPEKYIQSFSSMTESSEEASTKLLSSSQKEIFEKISEKIDIWAQSESDEHIVGVYGEKGIGKSKLLQGLSQARKDVQIINISISEKIDNFDKIFEISRGLDEVKEKAVILVDQAENLFLSQVGGFEALNRFLSLTQENSENRFWCISFNNYAWDFIQSVHKRTRFFCEVYRLNKWSEDEIKGLILRHHNLTGYKMIFDEILLAVRAEEGMDAVNYIESKFFGLLWDESLGNPMVAKEIWLKCIHENTPGCIRVGLPRERLESIPALPDDFYFVLASIVRHENLTVENLLKVTDLSEDVVRNAVKTCDEKGYVDVFKKQIRVTPLWQHSIYSTLRRKNFIYGS